jgi:SAM-dependent methyltransferase
MTSSSPSHWLVEPFTMGSRDDFARFRALLEASGFTEASLCAAEDVPTIHHFFSLSKTRTSFRDVRDAQSLFVRLFIDGAAVPVGDIRRVLSGDAWEAIDALSLLTPGRESADDREATVALYPVDGVYIASDRHVRMQSTGERGPPDVVYSAMTPETNGFLRLMPRLECEDYLDLCSGTAVAALVAARGFAKRATAIDITERSTRFGRFNTELNGLTNVDVRQGDLYADLAPRTFDMITAHPPYVPNFSIDYIYRDGGEDGEQISRRIVSELPAYLRRGGHFYCDCTATDREGARLEERMRTMLGESQREFDVVIGEFKSFDAVDRYAEAIRGRTIPFAELDRRFDAFKQLGIERFVSVGILLRRSTRPRPVGTARRPLTSRTLARDLEWLADWSVKAESWDEEDTERLLESRVRTLPTTELRSRSVVDQGRWSVEEVRLATIAPFAVEASCPGWYAGFLPLCDGQRTGRELFSALRAAEVVNEAATEEQFALVLRQLVDSGFVESDAFVTRAPDRIP